MVRIKIEEGSSSRMDKDDKNDPDSRNESGTEDSVRPVYRAVDGWGNLPDIILEDIFQLLHFKERYSCLTVCRHWYAIFFSPYVWRRLVYKEESFAYMRYSACGYDLMLSQYRLKFYLATVGQFVQSIIIPPTFEFGNLYKFLSILTNFHHFFDDCPMPALKVFQFTFACECRIPIVGPMIIGTGGRFLEQLTDLITVMKNLKQLKLNFLLLEPSDVPSVLEKVVNSCSESLVHLELLDFSKEKCPLFQVGMIHNLQKLVTTPHHINDDVIVMLAKSTKLKELVLIQDKYSVDCDQVSPDKWKIVQRLAPLLRVRLHIMGIVRNSLILQERAPVWCVLHDTPFARIRTPDMHRMVDNYKNTLQVYGHLQLPRKHGPRTFHHRGDAGLVLLVRHCPNLQRLYIRERLSTATLLIIAHEGKSLKELYVRKNAVIIRSDWPKPDQWEEWRYKWLQKTSQSYENVQHAISMMLNQKWRWLTDAEFKKLSVPF